MVGIIFLGHGCALLLCVAVVHVRDTTMVIDISLRALFFLSGVFYSAAYIPAEFLDYHLMNPIALHRDLSSSGSE